MRGLLRRAEPHRRRARRARGLAARLPGGWLLAAWAALTAVPVVAAAVPAPPSLPLAGVVVRLHDVRAGSPDPTALLGGELDARFEATDLADSHLPAGTYWLKLDSERAFSPAGIPVLVVHKARQSGVVLYRSRAGAAQPLLRATELPAFRGTHDVIFELPGGLSAGQSVYVKIDAVGRGLSELQFSLTTLHQALARGVEHARMIALSFGALTAMAVAALLIWFVLSDRLFVLYSSLFLLQALYVAFLSGQAFDWPVLSHALPLASHAWNVPAGLSGAISCLFVREIADLRHFSPRVHAVFGWIAWAFVLVTVANIGKFVGLGFWVNAVGNLLFLGTAVFTLVIAFVAWRRGSRAAGWFLIAWGLLEGATIATAVHLLINASEENNRLLYYYALPLSMVAAAVLIALGVADRLREQRLALSDAERRAQTDLLTGVLNRRSLLERLDAAGLRARTRGLPIAVLFIDLDHFKLINDSYGHLAGDACLRAVIAPIQAELRQSDVIGRYGGEEFVVILSSADAAAAHPIAQRIVTRVAAVSVEGFGTTLHMTCSIGIAASDKLGVWGESLIAQADAAVYVAKRAGRNQVQMAS